MSYGEADPFGRRFSRRHVLRSTAVGASGLLLPSVLAACGSSDKGASTAALSGPAGLSTVPTAAFKPSSAVGAKPAVPKRMAIILPDSAQIWQAVDDGFKQALQARGVEHVALMADDDPAKAVQQFNSAMSRGVGAIGSFPVDPKAQAPQMQDAIDRGIGVFAGVMAPSTCQAATDQAGLGKVWGEAAGRYITEKLGGSAQVVLFSEDAIPSIKPRWTALRAALKATAPNAKVVADEPFPETQEKSFKLANTVLTRNPGANVWLAPDPGILGALSALESAHKVTGQTALFGTNGDPSVLDVIRRGGPIKATFGFAFPPLTYAMGQFAADWLEGKTIPQVIYGTPFLIDSPAAIASFQRGSARPAEAFANGGGDYYRLVGEISYATRNRYLKVTA
ncbi:MAG TPA: sugar ABC transporter substrate-binding protein [Conexibacter sp.]|jgi:ribose transport system substrate-binding protein|nr:sugar ABC transporter substrate-binding protein [Conexibacter sp.]